MKICTKCNVEKRDDQFHWRSKKDNKRQAQCKICKNQYKYTERQRQASRDTRDKFREFKLSFLLENPCIDCGESNPALLEFDHRDPSRKSFGIAGAHHKTNSLEKLAAEVAKCDVRCVNCHRAKTHKEMNWWTPADGNNDTNLRNRNRAYVWGVLEKSGCIRCGENNPIKLDFDHIDPSNKINNVSRFKSSATLERLKSEIDKCQVLCANCHRLKTRKDIDSSG